LKTDTNARERKDTVRKEKKDGGEKGKAQR